ncbi:hypothetical protein E2C01_012922 [Portunus trituberculatus]|uniref:Uncharacterized protein n=1 Tax=Portunus trituberculatus TaxID=210409 RepID=A0A5B7DEW4_PORTR|nr:hypothetical protein [Portunus trituberculatus]
MKVSLVRETKVILKIIQASHELCSAVLCSAALQNSSGAGAFLLKLDHLCPAGEALQRRSFVRLSTMLQKETQSQGKEECGEQVLKC